MIFRGAIYLVNRGANSLSFSIHLELEDYGYEDYGVEDGKDDTLAEVSPEVSFKDMFNNVEVNIFTGEEL